MTFFSRYSRLIGLALLIIALTVYKETGYQSFYYLRAETAVGRWLDTHAPDYATLSASRYISWIAGLNRPPQTTERAKMIRQSQPDFVVTNNSLADQLLTQQSWFQLYYSVVETESGGQNGRLPLQIWQKQTPPVFEQPLIPSQARVPGIVEWRGYQQWPSRLQPGETVQVVLVGDRQSGTNLAAGWETILRMTSLLDETPLAEAVYSLDDSALTVSHVVQTMSLTIPRELAPGAYLLNVAFRPKGASHPVQLIENNDIQRIFDRLQLAPVIVPWAENLPDSQRVDANFGQEIWLRHAELTGIVAPNETLSLSLYWEAQSVPEFNYTVFVHLLNEAGEWVAGRDAQPMSARYPTRLWQPDEIVRDEHPVWLPPDLPPGNYQLFVGFYRLKTGERLAVWDANQIEQPNGAFFLQTVTVGT